jgi:hypothetical protein
MSVHDPKKNKECYPSPTLYRVLEVKYDKDSKSILGPYRIPDRLEDCIEELKIIPYCLVKSSDTTKEKHEHIIAKGSSHVSTQKGFVTCMSGGLLFPNTRAIIEIFKVLQRRKEHSSSRAKS